MGRLMGLLCDVSTVPPDLEALLGSALVKRNWLAHACFRERADEFMTSAGRDKMLVEVDECRECFERADAHLEEIVSPLCIAAGITDEMLAQAFRDMMPPEVA